MIANLAKLVKNAPNFRYFCHSIAEVLKEGVTGERRKIKGWVKSVRDGKMTKFCTLVDGSQFQLQLVLDKKQEELTRVKIQAGAALETTGKLVESKGKNQVYDFEPETISIIGDVEQTPIAPFGTKFQRDLAYSRQFLHFRPLNQTFMSFLRLRGVAKEAVRDFFKERKFLEIDTPILTTSDCEGSGESFYVTPSNKSIYNKNPKIVDVQELDEELNVDAQEKDSSNESMEEFDDREFFGRPVFLSVSGQLHLEACAGALKGVYTFNPAFRAESSLTRQHIAEFYMVEAELAFLDDLEVLMEMVEQLFHYCLEKILAESRHDFNACLNFTKKDHVKCVEKIISTRRFRRVNYVEAVEILQKAAEKENFSRNLQLGQDFGKEHERYLVKHFGSVPIFVTHFPADLKPFYMKQEESTGNCLSNVAACFDLLAPEAGEICGGSLRESDYMLLKSRLERMRLQNRLRWYADLRRVGYARTGGFGLGFERYLQCLTGFRSVKDCIPFPRWYKHCSV